MINITLYHPKSIYSIIPFPQNWNELLPDEIELIAFLMLSDFQNSVKMKVVIFNAFIKIRAEHHNIKLPPSLLESMDYDEVVTQLFPAMDWIFNSNTLSSQPYKSLNFQLIFHTDRFIGPQDDFNNMTVGEYEDAETYFFEFVENNSIASLAAMAAILFRPKNKPYLSINNGQLVTYNHEEYLPFFIKLKKEKLFSIFLWFTGCRNMMATYFPILFSDETNKSTKPDRLSFTKCIHAGAGAKNGTRQQIRMLPIKEFFFELNEEAKQVKEYNKISKSR